MLTQPEVGLENVGAENFVQLLNVYRDFDQLARMPGWTKFRPNSGAGVDSQYLFDGSATLLKLAELVRGDGTRVIVGASQTLIKYYDTATDAWVQIGSGFSSSGLPWQAEVIANTVILNNTVNLPVWWQIGDAAVTPMHELREAGIASVGAIGSYNGFLFVGNIVEVKGDQLAIWMNGYANYAASGTSAKVANFNIVTGDHRTQFDVTTGASTITATLPTTTLGSYPLYVWIKKVDAGAGTVITSPVIEDEAVVLDSQNDIALVWWNGRRWVARVFPAGTIDAHDPYGITPTAIQEHIADEQAWSDLGQPTNWAPLVSVPMGAASTTIYLPFKPYNWTAGQTRVAVVNGGPDSGTLGGQSTYPEGVMIRTVGAFSAANMGVPITIEVTTDTLITYPRVVDVTRWTDVSTFVGKQRLGNGRKITVMRELNGAQVIYHEDGMFMNRWTAQATRPFALREKYSGKAVPLFAECIATVLNSYHIYPSVEGGFVQFDGLTDPIAHPICQDAKDLFFTGLSPTDRCWAIDNPSMQAIWFVRPTKVMVFRYRKETQGVSEMDATVNAAVFSRKPGGTDAWFVIGQTNKVLQFGMVNGAATTWLRDGSAPAVPARIKSGLNAFRNQIAEKTLHSYTPVLSSPSPDVEIEVQLRGTHNPSATLTDFMASAANLPSPAGDNFVPCFFQAIYLQDEITLVDDRDVDFRLSARLFEFEVVGGLQITRSGNN